MKYINVYPAIFRPFEDKVSPKDVLMCLVTSLYNYIVVLRNLKELKAAAMLNTQTKVFGSRSSVKRCDDGQRVSQYST